MSKKIFTLMNILVLMALVAAGCSPATTAQPTQPTNVAPQPTAPQVTQAPVVEEQPVVEAGLPNGTGKRIAVIWGSLGNDFNVKVHDATVAALQAMGAEIVVDTNAGGDRRWRSVARCWRATRRFA